MIKVINESKIILIINANDKPILRVRFWFSKGSRSVMIEIKMMLSIPSTISKKVSVTSEIYVSG